MCLLSSMGGSPGSRGDRESMMGLAAETLVCAPPDFADLLACDSMPLVAGGMLAAMLTGGWL